MDKPPRIDGDFAGLPPCAHHSRGELVEFKRGFRYDWQPGWITEVGPHSITVRSTGGRRYVIEPGHRGKVRAPTAIRLDQLAPVIAPVARQALPRKEAPPLPPVPARPVLRPVPKPRPPSRDADYLAFVRSWPCTACGLPGPSEAHHHGPQGIGQRADDHTAIPLCRTCRQHITATGRLPDQDDRATYVIVLRAQNGLLIEWFARQMAQRPRLACG